MNRPTNQLIQQILTGDKGAERDLYLAHERGWFRLCLRYAKNRYEAEDMLQEGLVFIYKDLHQFNPDKGQFTHWSNRVLVNAALRYLKRNQWQQSFSDLDEVHGHVEWEEARMERVSAKQLTKVIQQLPMGYRVVFNMYVLEGFTHQEIAEYLNISIGTSKSQLSKAKRMLRKELEVFLKSY